MQGRKKRWVALEITLWLGALIAMLLNGDWLADFGGPAADWILTGVIVIPLMLLAVFGRLRFWRWDVETDLVGRVGSGIFALAWLGAWIDMWVFLVLAALAYLVLWLGRSKGGWREDGDASPDPPPAGR